MNATANVLCYKSKTLSNGDTQSCFVFVKAARRSMLVLEYQ